MLQRRLDAVLFLPLHILGKLEQGAGSGQMLIGIGCVLAHGADLADHQFFHVGAEGSKTAGDGHIIGNHQFVQFRLVHIGVQVILNSNFFHDYLPYKYSNDKDTILIT